MSGGSKKRKAEDVPSGTSDTDDVQALKRKIARRDKRLSSLTAKLETQTKEIGSLESHLKVAEEGHDKSAAENETLRQQMSEQSEEIERLHKVEEELLKENSLLKKTTEEKKVIKQCGWRKYHKNSQGKLVPSDDAAEMSQRIDALMRDENEMVEIQKGAFVRFLPGARAYGFYTEAGTNIVLPSNTQLPEPIKAAVDTAVKESMKLLSRKSSNLSQTAQQVEAFHEYVTSLNYCFAGDHQGPVYVSGRKPALKPEWTRDALYTSEALIAEQPSFLQQIIRFALERSKVAALPEKVKKESLVRVLKSVKVNHRKHGLTMHGTDKGRAQRKLVVPEAMDPGKSIIKRNSRLPPLPPLYDGRTLSIPDGPRIGMPETQKKFNKEPRKRKPENRNKENNNKAENGTSSADVTTRQDEDDVNEEVDEEEEEEEQEDDSGGDGARSTDASSQKSDDGQNKYHGVDKKELKAALMRSLGM